jgi:uncharacterized protein
MLKSRKMKCPVCRKTVERPQKDDSGRYRYPKYYPFCSERCQLVDLGRWLDQDYSISESLGVPESFPAEEDS